MQYVGFVLLAYLCGSIPFGKLVGRAYGIDIQRRGSGNIGFANVLRVLGWRAGVATLLGDVVKGLVPTYLAYISLDRSVAFWIGLAAIAGHLFPVWLKFKGGKGIATGLGVVIVLQPLAAAIGLGIYGLTFATTRNSALGSLVGTVCIVVAGSLLRPSDWWRFGILLLIALWTHRKNIIGKLPNYDI